MTVDLAGLQELLLSQGACVVAAGDLSTLNPSATGGLRVGLVIGVALDRDILRGMVQHPTLAYQEHYLAVNQHLDALAILAGKTLRQAGFTAVEQGSTISRLVRLDLCTTVPHKTVATRAGVGWIGRCALLVTERFGSAIRLVSVLTDTPLSCATPIDTSRCGTCRICVNRCPGRAVLGPDWQVGRPREEYFDAAACFDTTLRWRDQLHLSRQICGLCMVHCPWTRRYLDPPT